MSQTCAIFRGVHCLAMMSVSCLRLNPLSHDETSFLATETMAWTMPMVSVITLNSHLRKDFQWNYLINFLKQNYDGPMELIVANSDDIQEVENSKASDWTSKFTSYVASLPNITDMVSKNSKREIRVFEGRGRLGQVRQETMKISRGEIIVNMDDDDVYDVSHVSHVVSEFQNYPEAKIVYQRNVLHHTINIDGSSNVEGGQFGPYVGAVMAFKKSALSTCQYGGNWATEEHSLVHCINKSAHDIRPLSSDPSNGVGLNKLGWEASVCHKIWRENLLKQMDQEMSYNAYMNYRHRVIRTIHYLQYLNGGLNTLNFIRGLLDEDQQIAIPPSKIEHNIAKPSECKAWHIFAQIPSKDVKVYKPLHNAHDKVWDTADAPSNVKFDYVLY